MTAHVFEHSTSKGGDRTVLLALAWFADDNGKCWPSVEKIATYTQMSRRGVQKCLRNLEESGEVICDRSAGRGNTNLYLIPTSEKANTIRELRSEKANSVRTTKNDKRRTIEHKRRTERQEKANGGSPKPSGTIKEPPYSGAQKEIRKGVRKDKPESVEQVVEYFKSEQSTEIEAHKFFDHFTANGWKVSGRAAMKDWKAAARNWIRNAPTFNRTSRNGAPGTPQVVATTESRGLSAHEKKLIEQWGK